MNARWRRLLAAVGVAAALVVPVAGCGPTMRDLPLPGSGVSGSTMPLHARFDDALNLTTGAVVKVDGVDQGKVTSVGVRDFKAVVAMQVRRDAKIRAGATARLRYTTPLGELFVDVTNPATGTVLPAGATLDPKRSTTAPTVEDTLAEASLLINGGGLNQLQTVVDQMNKLLGGRESTVREVLSRSDSLLGDVNASSADIDRTLRSLNEVSQILSRRHDTIRATLRDLAPAARALRANLPGLTRLLTELNRFARSANATVAATREDLRTVLDETGPVLASIAALRGQLGETLADITRLGSAMDTVVPNDFLQLGLHLDLGQLAGFPTPPTPPKPPSGGGLPCLPVLGCLPGSQSGSQSGTKVPKLPDGTALGGLGGLLTGRGVAPQSGGQR